MQIDASCKKSFHSDTDSDKPPLTFRHSYIANLDPNAILALAETASPHQVLALREAIWKHIASQTSIGISILVSIPGGLTRWPLTTASGLVFYFPAANPYFIL